MSDSLRVIVLQLQSVDSWTKNLEQILSLLEGSSKSEIPTLVCLPENSLYMRLKEGEKIEGFELNHPALLSLAQVAVERSFTFHLGSIPLKWVGKLANSSVMISSQGEISASYQKVHLFDIALEGQAPIRESDVFHHGSGPQSFELGGWKWGQTICYDLRFAELFGHYAKEQMDALLVPSAFLPNTGEAHWHVLLRARAIESQSYVVAAAQAGTHRSEKGQRTTYGHSLVVDPWGRIVAEGSADQPEKIELILSKSEIAKVRRQIPMALHRRLL